MCMYECVCVFVCACLYAYVSGECRHIYYFSKPGGGKEDMGKGRGKLHRLKTGTEDFLA